MDGEAAGEDLGDFEGVVEEDDVGVGAGAEGAFFEFDAEDFGGIEGEHLHGAGEGDAEFDDVAESAIEGERAAGEAAFGGAAANTAANRDFHAAERVLAVGHTGGGKAVADEDDAVGSFGLQQDFHGDFVDVNAVGDEFGGKFGSGEDGADDAGIAVGERAHGVVNVGGVVRAVSDGGASLFVGGVGVADGNDHAEAARGVNTRHSTEKFGSDGEDAGVAGCGVEELLEEIGGGRLEKFGAVDTTSLFAEEGAFEVKAENFGARVRRFVLRRDVARDAFDGAQSVIGRRGNGGGEEGSGAELGDFSGDGGEGFVVAFHNVAAAGAVDVDVDETGDGGGIFGADFLCAGRKSDAGAIADGFNCAVADENAGGGNFSFGSDGFADVEKSSGHRCVRIVAERARKTKPRGEWQKTGNERKTGGCGIRPGVKIEMEAVDYMLFSGAISMLASLRLSPLTLPLTVT